MGLLVRYCVRPLRDNLVSVPMPDGELERFRARAVPECNDLVSILDVELAFDPLEGTHSRLEALDYHAGRLLGGQLSDPAEQGVPLDPAHYLDEIIDPRGIAVARNRYDAEGRLIAQIDAAGHRIELEHLPEADLEVVRDRRGIHWLKKTPTAMGSF